MALAMALALALKQNHFFEFGRRRRRRKKKKKMLLMMMMMMMMMNDDLIALAIGAVHTRNSAFAMDTTYKLHH